MGNERKKIMAVDDNVENLTGLKNILKDSYDTFPCPSAQKMFTLLEHIQPDLILLDVEMPEMSGYEAAEKLKSSDKFKAIPIIFLTSMEDEESKKKGLSLGAVDFIKKPIVAPMLLQRLETLFK
jgi:putative two-component system response regulator